MTQTRTHRTTGTYTVVDIERVVRRVKADLVMIADSTGGWTPQGPELRTRCRAPRHGRLSQARRCHPVKPRRRGEGHPLRGRHGCRRADRAADPAGCSGRRWPGPSLRIILRYTADFTAAARAAIKSQLKINWSPTDVDTSHARCGRPAAATTSATPRACSERTGPHERDVDL